MPQDLAASTQFTDCGSKNWTTLKILLGSIIIGQCENALELGLRDRLYGEALASLEEGHLGESGDSSKFVKRDESLELPLESDVDLHPAWVFGV